MKKITFLLAILVTAVTGSYGQCLAAVDGLYPSATYTPATCDGSTLNSITTAGYASEYSNVNVTLGETYTFTSSVATDFITIGSEDGLTAIVWGENGTLTWIADLTGIVRFYTHLDNTCGAAQISRTRGIICGTPPTCPKPLNVVVGSITTNSADFTWAAGGSETEWEVLVLPNGDPAPDAATAGNAVSGASAYQASALNDSAAYQFYVRANCGGGDFSSWTAPTNFVTSCVVGTDFNENFDAAVAFPPCWGKVGTLGSTYVQASASAPSAPNVLYLYGSSATAQGVVAMPPVNNAGAGTYRLKFKARSNFTVGGVIEVGYLTDSADATTFVSLQSFTTTSITVYDTFVANLGTDPSISEVLAFRHSGVPAYSVLIDDVVWEPIPAAFPSCASNFVAATDASCGNFATQLTWDAATDADGYNLTIGTTAGGNDILDAQNIGGVTSYSFSGTSNTTYYYKVVPFNVVGAASGCTEESFTTFSTGCYCTSLPTSNDGSGVTNVQIGSTDFPNGDVTYFDNTATPVALAQGISNNVQVSFATGFTYGTNIWIDFNDNLTFEATELVFSGTSLATNPTILDASFVVPADATLGDHRMRIGTADSGQATPNPCFSGTYGVTLDYTVSITVASCTPGAATLQAVPDCTANVFNVDVDVTDLGSGTPSITDGTTVWPVTGLGIVNVGPFNFGTPVTLTLNHGVEAICNVNLGTINLAACPPTNDNFADAIAVNCGDSVTGSTVLASLDEDSAPDGFGADLDAPNVWYSFTGSGTPQTVTLSLCGSGYDSSVLVYTGTSGNLSLFAGNDDAGTTTCPGAGSRSYLTFNSDGVSTYYITIEGWNFASTGAYTMDVTCTDVTPPAVANQTCSTALVVPVDGTTIDSDNSFGDVTATQPSCDTFGTIQDVWFSFVAPVGGTVDCLVTNGTITSLNFNIYSGDCTTLTPVTATCNSDLTAPTTESLTGLVEGSTYFVQVWSNATEQGTFSIKMTDLGLGVTNSKLNDFTFYPNPVTDYLNLSYVSNISKVEIFNLLGQQVLSKAVNATESKIDMSNLNAGTYLVKVNSGDLTKTIKVIKN